VEDIEARLAALEGELRGNAQETVLPEFRAGEMQQETHGMAAD